MRNRSLFTREGLTRACTTLAFGVAFAVALAAPARAQQSGGSDARGGASGSGSSRGEESRRWTKEDFGHPMHDAALSGIREEIELLEVQIAAKRARIRVTEAKLKQAKDDTRDILQAELEADRAELREPELLLKRAQNRLKETEQAGHEGAMFMGHMGGLGMGMEHPGMGMEHLGMGMGMGMMGHPMAHHWAMMRDLQIENNLNLLRVAVERLEAEMDGILEGSIKPGAGLKATPSTGDATASGGSSGGSGSGSSGSSSGGGTRR